MKRTKPVQPKTNHEGRHLTETVGGLTGRRILSYVLGTSFEGKRNLYDALGYDLTIYWDKVVARYDRQDLAAAVIDRPIKATWRGGIELKEGGEDDEETKLEKAFKDLLNNHSLKSRFKRLDKLVSLGSYAVLVFGFDDTRVTADFEQPVSPGTRRLLYVKPVGQGNVEIKQYENDPTNARFGLPLYYEVTFKDPQYQDSDKVQYITVHYTRILHVTGELMESEVEGVSDLKVIWNRLQDLEKILGGSAEMFWLGARPGYQADIRDNATLNPDDEEALESQFQEYEHNMRRILQTKGIDLQSLQQQVSDPSNQFEIQIQAISAITGIPKRILLGSEQGELSSGQDRTEWLEKIQERREEYAETRIVRPFVNKLLQFGVLPGGVDVQYDIKWDDLFSPSEKDRADVGKVRSEAIKAYGAQPAMQEIVPPEQFVKYFLGLDPSVADKILQEINDTIFQQQQEENGDDNIEME